MKFRSGFEERIYNDAIERGKSLQFESIKLEYKILGKYCPDFILPNGVVVEAKGYFDAKARAKMVAVKKNNPDEDIRFLFTDASKLVRKGSKFTYADWCERYSFPYAEGDSIPEEWFKSKKEIKGT